MKKVLFIGPYRQKDHWGQTSRDYIKAILTNPTISLSARPIYYSKFIETNPEKEFISLENVYHTSYDVIIQHGFPSSFNINNYAKNVGLVNVEFSKGYSTINSIVMNRLDEIYVCTEHEKNALISLGITKPITIIPRPLNLEAIVNSAKQNHTINLPSFINSTFKFYCQTSVEERGNLDMIVAAFHLAFNEHDRVSLIIAPNVSHDISSHKMSIEKLCDGIKHSLRTNKIFKNEIILANSYNHAAEIALHNTGNCYINLSSGCNYDASVLMAMYLGKTPIVMSSTGLESIIGGDKSGFLVKSENYPILMESPPLPESYDLFNANYFWKKPNMQSLIDTLKKVYHTYKNENKTYKNKQDHGTAKINEFSYKNIGNMICL